MENIKIVFWLLLYGVGIALMTGGILRCRNDNHAEIKTEFKTKTIIVHDTVKVDVPLPASSHVSRIEKLTVPYSPPTNDSIVADTIQVPFYLPIEQKTFKTPQFSATIEGYKPNLLSLELYPETRIITNTETITITKKQRFGIGIQAGYGFNGQKFTPYVGVGIQYNIVNFGK